MIIRPHSISLSLLSFSLLLPTPISSADSPFTCSHISVNALTFNLSKLAGEHTVSRTRSTPPSTMLDRFRFDLCGDLKVLEGVADDDQCPSGTRACLTKVNKKGDEGDRIVAVIPIAQSSSLNAQYSTLSSPKGLSLTLHGPSYPSTPSESTQPQPQPQSLALALLCASSDSPASDPVFTSYNGSVLAMEWIHAAGCGFAGEDDDETGDGGGTEDGEGEKKVGSGIGWFFLVLLLAFITYFALGAYYNYTTYGASGVDLIPHRDFWQEVPYMARDVISHLCSSVRPRRTLARGGYIAV